MTLAWLLVAGVVLSTVLADLLQSSAMKRHGAIETLSAWAAVFKHGRLVLSIVFMATSFFCFLKLLEVADLSFAVPATAASIVLETIAARWVLGERVSRERWLGAAAVAAGVWLLAGS